MDDIERSETSRPSIAHLDDAIVSDPIVGARFIPDIGDKVIIEKNYPIGGKFFWLSTDTYVVKAIDNVTGRLELWNLNCENLSLSNYRSGPSKGLIFKLPDSSGHGAKLWRQRKKI